MLTEWFEAFEAGAHHDTSKNGDITEYTIADLDEMVELFKAGVHVPPVVITHAGMDMALKYKSAEEQKRIRELADGRIVDVKREGDKLLIQADVTPEHAKLWTDNRLLTWSVGIYKDFQHTGKKALRHFKLGLDHVAALGKTPPAVKGLNYNPQFAEDKDNGDFVVMNFEETKGKKQMTLEEALAMIETLKAKIAELEKGKAANMSEKDVNAAMKLASEAEAKVATLTAKIASLEKEKTDVKRTADFAEIERLVEEAHKGGLPTTHGDHLRTVLAAEKGHMASGIVTFAEGKSGKLSDSILALGAVAKVPIKPEGTDAVKKPSTTKDDTDAKREAAIASFAETNKLDINKSADYSTAMLAVKKAQPDLFVDVRDRK